MNRRSGFTLLEMLVVIGMSSMLAGIATFMLFALITSHNTGREQLEYCRNANRLEEQFRRDVHATQDTSTGKKEGILELLPVPPNTATIRYQCLDDRIDRSELQGEKIISQESYILMADLETSIKTEPFQDVKTVTLNIMPKQQTTKLFYLAPIRIEAILGRDSRLSKIHKVQEVIPKEEKEESEKAATEQPAAENANKEQPAAEDATTEQQATEKAATEQPTKDNATDEQPESESEDQP